MYERFSLGGFEGRRARCCPDGSVHGDTAIRLSPLSLAASIGDHPHQHLRRRLWDVPCFGEYKVSALVYLRLANTVRSRCALFLARTKKVVWCSFSWTRSESRVPYFGIYTQECVLCTFFWRTHTHTRECVSCTFVGEHAASGLVRFLSLS